MVQRTLSPSTKTSIVGQRGLHGGGVRVAGVFLSVIFGLAYAIGTASAAPCGFYQELVPPTPGVETSTFESDSAIMWSLDSSDSYVRWHVTLMPGRNAGGDPIGHSTPVRLYYGNANASASPNYATRDEMNRGTATSPPMNIPEGATDVFLVFNNKYEVEARDPITYDKMSLYLSYDDGLHWYPSCSLSPARVPDGHLAESVCSDGTREGAYPCPRDHAGQSHPVWERRAVSLGDGGGYSLKVRFEFDTVDAFENEAMGWMVDDIQVAYTPPGVSPPGVTPSPEEVPVMGPIFIGVLVAGIAVAGGLAARRTRD